MHACVYLCVYGRVDLYPWACSVLGSSIGTHIFGTHYTCFKVDVGFSNFTFSFRRFLSFTGFACKLETILCFIRLSSWAEFDWVGIFWAKFFLFSNISTPYQASSDVLVFWKGSKPFLLSKWKIWREQSLVTLQTISCGFFHIFSMQCERGNKKIKQGRKKLPYKIQFSAVLQRDVFYFILFYFFATAALTHNKKKSPIRADPAFSFRSKRAAKHGERKSWKKGKGLPFWQEEFIRIQDTTLCMYVLMRVVCM